MSAYRADDPTGPGNGGQQDPLPSDPAAIERVIEARRRRLADTVDELAVRAHPKEIARRGAEGVKERARSAVETEGGQVRPERLAAIGGALALLIALLVLIRRRRG